MAGAPMMSVPAGRRSWPSGPPEVNLRSLPLHQLTPTSKIPSRRTRVRYGGIFAGAGIFLSPRNLSVATASHKAGNCPASTQSGSRARFPHGRALGGQPPAVKMAGNRRLGTRETDPARPAQPAARQQSQSLAWAAGAGSCPKRLQPADP
ncbi:hypothetical protein L7E55_07660 [Pelotomaculum isophthalicicum JI]|uniref:Uncharacterized protein n=1 Tax=Pelotomaculum isophthalicicum JI TaxID=947010 RepID=A0A9X4H2B0_9FIRM|nr:hypothetical protein [Pelotomaculum isophthalicicum]MDF9408236.1 hypothetical protein [Pelotomaculum isophthalicicum JI]